MQNLFNGIYKNKTVLVTGHTGFKGSWLSLWLKELGANVIGYALDPYTENDNFVVSKISEYIVDIRGDVRDYVNLQKVVNEYKPEIIFHLAAQPLVRESYLNPRYTYDTNVGGTVNVLEAFRLSKRAKVCIIITSDKCYENKEWIWGYRENDRLGGYDPYSSSKACAELVTNAYIKSFFNPDKFQYHNKAVASVRAGNVIGGGDWRTDRLIPDAIRALEKNKPIEMRNPHSIRPWQFVLEPLYGYLQLCYELINNPKKFSGSWNFGPDYTSILPVSELVKLILKEWGSGTWLTANIYDELHEASLLVLDTSKSKVLLSWTPRVTIEKTVKLTIDWYKNYKLNVNMFEFDNEQIQKFVKDCV